MTLQKLKDEGALYGFNELTGQMVSFVSPTRPHETLLPGDSGSPMVLCTLLFDEGHVEHSWSEISFAEAVGRLAQAAEKVPF